MSASGRSLPPDPFEPLLRWTQKEGGRALARLWDVERSALAAAGKECAEKENAMRRVDAASFAARELLPLAAKGAASLAYLDACLAVDAPGERDPLTLTAFVRALRDSARATAAASQGADGAREGENGGGPPGSAVRFQERSGTARGRRRRRARRRDGALARVRRARVAELVDAAVGTLKRRFQREGNAHGGVDPVTLTRFLADASVAPGDARAALAELRKWEGFPLDVRFARFRRAMRPRSVRLAERKRAEPEAREETRGDAFGPEIEAELASARADRLAAEGRSRGAFAPGKALERSPVKVDVFRPSASSPTRAGVNGDSSPSARLPARKSPSAYRTPEKSPGAPRGEVRRVGIEERFARVAVLSRRRARGDARGG